MSKFFRQTMYPELKKAGGLSKAVDIEFEKLNSILRVTVDEFYDRIPFTYARVENANKFSQINIAAEEKLYMLDFWRNGVCLAHGKTDNISELAQVVDYWLTQNVSTQVLAEHFNFVQPSDKAEAFDGNREVEYMWKWLVSEDDSLGLKEFIALASKDEVLNKLFPFTSLYTLCLSKCTGYPFDTTDLPNVTPKQFGHFAMQNYGEYKYSNDNSSKDERLFVVTRNKREYLGEGNAAEALMLVKDCLPDNIRPAVKGSVET